MKPLLRISYLLVFILVSFTFSQAQPYITGHPVVCGNGGGYIYTLQNPPAGAINWTCSSGLTIISGQGTSSVSVNFPSGITPLYDIHGNAYVEVSASTASGTYYFQSSWLPYNAPPITTGPMTTCTYGPVVEYRIPYTAYEWGAHVTVVHVLGVSVTGGTLVSTVDSNVYYSNWRRDNVFIIRVRWGGGSTGTLMYSAERTYSNSYCSDTKTYTINLAAANTGASTVQLGNDTTACVLPFPLDAGSGHSWVGWNTGASTQIINPGSPGTYVAWAVDSGGCSSDTIVIQSGVQPSPPVISPGGMVSSCISTPVALSLSQTYSSYLWSGGSTAATFTPSTSGNYTCTVTDAAGCTSAATPVRVNFLPSPSYYITPSTAAICSGTPVTLGTSLAQPASYSYLWSNGATTPTTTVSSPGTYSVTVTGSNGCPSVRDRIVGTGTTPPPPVISPPYPMYCGTPYPLTTSSGYNSYVWSSSFSTILSTQSSVTVNQPGIYTVTVDSGNGCKSSASVNVTSSPQPVTIESPTVGGICLGMTAATLNTSQPWQTYHWSNGSSQPSISAGPGTYTVTVSAPGGCTLVSGSFTVSNINACPIPAAPVLQGTTPSSISLSWARVACARSYRIQYRQLGGSLGGGGSWNTVTVLDPGTSVTITGLSSNTAYEIRMSAYCNILGSSWVYSPSIYVSTPVIRAGDPDPTPEAGPSAFTLELWPNPNAGQFTVSYPAAAAGEVNLRVVDLEGRIVYADVRVMEEGVNLLELNLPPLAAGLYLLRMASPEGVHMRRFRVQE